MSAKAATSTLEIRKNMRAFTPPKNKMPMAITAITMNAPMSGSASSKLPMMATAAAMGQTALMKSSLSSILRTI